MSELGEIRERTARIETLLEGSIRDTKDYRESMDKRMEKHDTRLGNVEKKFWQFTGGLTVLIGVWEVFKGKLFKP